MFLTFTHTLQKWIKQLSFLLLLTGLIILHASFQNPGKVSVKMETKTLNKGKAMVINAEIYYQFDQGKMLTRYMPPLDYLFFTNQKGEAKIYYPKTNEVYSRQSAEFDSEKSLLYFFLSNKLNDLGLKDMGFTISDTRFEEHMVISTWFPPAQLSGFYSRVELVHENYRPIYIAYFNPNGKMIKKIFYYDYSSFPQFSLPLKVVEISYSSPTDSIVSKITYSDIRTGDKANSNYFNFKIPLNAKAKQ